MRLSLHAIVNTPMYARDTRKYMKIQLDEKSRLKVDNLHNHEAARYKVVCPPAPMQHDILDIKIPWRYNRVDCMVNGLVPVQDMEAGHKINCAIEFCGSWTLGMFWKFVSITSAENAH